MKSSDDEPTQPFRAVGFRRPPRDPDEDAIRTCVTPIYDALWREYRSRLRAVPEGEPSAGGLGPAEETVKHTWLRRTVFIPNQVHLRQSQGLIRSLEPPAERDSDFQQSRDVENGRPDGING